MSWLEELEAIKQLKARYCRLVDTKQWDEWRACFTDDCLIELPPRPPVGRDAVVAGSSTLLRDAVTVHHVHAPEITRLAELSAAGVWAMSDRGVFTKEVEELHGCWAL